MTPQQVMPYTEVICCLMSYSSNRQSWHLCSLVQMADMQRQMASLPPGFVQQQMASLNSMPPEVLQQRMREASAVEPQGQGQHTSVPLPHEQQEVCDLLNLAGHQTLLWSKNQSCLFLLPRLFLGLSLLPCSAAAEGGRQPALQCRKVLGGCCQV